jgi:hypothetical protein
MVSNYYIDDVLKSFHNFKGTFSSNNIPLIKNNESVICNFSKVGEEGSHFIFLTCYEENLYYFDSLNLSFLPEDVAAYFLHFKNVINLSKRIQHPNSSFCGFYCILAFLACNFNIVFFVNNILTIFKKHSLENDIICIKLIQCLFPFSLQYNQIKK